MVKKQDLAAAHVEGMLQCILPPHLLVDKNELFPELPKGMLETPGRVARMFIELTRGYHADMDQLLKTFDEPECDEMVVVRKHRFVSLCEHHLVMFEGHATVGYIPNGRVVGLSKLARLVDAYAYRFQLQERLTRQIADTLQEKLQPKGVGVVVTARHLCMCGRGVDSPEAETVTSAVRGIFKEDALTRSEFMRLLETRNGG